MMMKFDRTAYLPIYVYAISAFIIVGFAVSNFHVLERAGHIANSISRAAEETLVVNEITAVEKRLAADQWQYSYWDDTVAAFKDGVNQDFVQSEMLAWIWADYNIDRTIVLTPNLVPIISIFEDQLDPNVTGQTYIDRNSDLITAAQKHFLDNRQLDDDGKVIVPDPVYSDHPIYASEIRLVDGALAVVSVQAIVPTTMEFDWDGEPNFMLSIRTLSETDLAGISRRIDLAGFSIVPIDAVPDGYAFVDIEHASDNLQLRAVWEPDMPSYAIWQESVPMLVTMLVLIALGLTLIAVRHGRGLAELHKSQSRNKFLANHDALTGLPNRLHFDEELEQSIANGQLESIAVICVDLDHFKQVNDTFGHQSGDAVLRAVATRLAKAVGDKGMAARVGGDEFIVLLREGQNEDHVLTLCDEIIDRVCEEIIFDNGSANVGASVGVAWWPSDALTAKTIIRSADQALYRAKAQGRGRAMKASKPAEERRKYGSQSAPDRFRTSDRITTN